MAIQETHTPLVPSLVLSATVGPVTVTTKLYGAVTPARVAKEKTEVKYRAEQLAPAPPRVRREFIPREARDDFDEETVVVRGGGRRR